MDGTWVTGLVAHLVLLMAVQKELLMVDLMDGNWALISVDLKAC